MELQKQNLEAEYSLEQLCGLMDPACVQACEQWNAAPRPARRTDKFYIEALLFQRPEGAEYRLYPSRVYRVLPPSALQEMLEDRPLYLVVLAGYNRELYVAKGIYQNFTQYDNWDNSLFRLHADSPGPGAWRLHKFYCAPAVQRNGLGTMVLREFLQVLPADTRRIVINAQATHRYIKQSQLKQFYIECLTGAGYALAGRDMRETHYNLDFQR